MEEYGRNAQIKPIKFKLIPEDTIVFEDGTSKQQIENFQDVETANLTGQELKPNFSFEYSYPAVIFDNVCFTIDKSKQQANFMNECLFNLKRCINSKADASEHKVDILKSVNLSVPYGSIFGLLGPSSCGKTTLLRCLVGLLKPSSGDIRLFCQSADDFDDDIGNTGGCCNRRSSGRRSEKSKVPGSNVGYMPQDLGLYEDFTVRQLLTMFGQYMRMGSKLITARIEFMAKFLDLPPVDRQIMSLSGGQKRRVSFAIACLHNPPLIILDEPTVGVDPLLRKSIWKYLRRLANDENKTIIITTHYIEEAAQADQVAFMRAGEILVQDTPSQIMKANECKTLEEAFLKICNNIQNRNGHPKHHQLLKLYPQPKFNWHNKFDFASAKDIAALPVGSTRSDSESVVRQLKLRAKKKRKTQETSIDPVGYYNQGFEIDDLAINKFSTRPNTKARIPQPPSASDSRPGLWIEQTPVMHPSKNGIEEMPHRRFSKGFDDLDLEDDDGYGKKLNSSNGKLRQKLEKTLTLLWALLYKNYRRNVNSIPLLVFQFLLPMIQMISFSLCVGGRPTNIGLGLVNLDHPSQLDPAHLLTTLGLVDNSSATAISSYIDESPGLLTEELLSSRFLSFVDESMIAIKPYDNLDDALRDVRKAKLWAAMEIGENFTTTILKRFDMENFYQLDPTTIQQSVIKLYPDRSNKILDMICHRSLVNSYRTFLSDQFEHFTQLPIEVKEPIFSIKPNLISNSIDGYTESIAAGLLASLTYIMAAGLTTFIMVVERSAGILERTFTSGINPVAYLLVHAVFRSLVMMLQIAAVMFLTFYILQQPHVGSICLAYLMLMILNLTGISYGLLISSIVTDQNGAALTIVSSLVVKITLSGILWPFEAIPRWLRTICYIQPLTMPIHALKTITLKGGSLGDSSVYIGFLVSITWMVLFLTIAARRFKFYQY